MARRFFDPENSLWHWIGKVPELFCLSLFWLVLCVPVITIAPASIALYDAVVRKLRPDEKGLFRRFFTTFWKELGRGILLSLLWLVIAAALTYCYNLLTTRAEADSSLAVITLVYQVSLLIPIGVFLWVIPLEARFVYGFWQLHKTALVYAFAYLPQTALLLLLAALALVGCWYMPVFILIIPAVLALLLSLPTEKVFRPLISPETIEEA
jgi:uncharacterized membrane protein YesL